MKMVTSVSQNSTNIILILRYLFFYKKQYNMKTIIIILALMLSFTVTYAQDYTQNGTTFVENKQ